MTVSGITHEAHGAHAHLLHYHNVAGQKLHTDFLSQTIYTKPVGIRMFV